MNRRASLEFWQDAAWVTYVIGGKLQFRVYGTMREALHAIRFYHETGVA